MSAKFDPINLEEQLDQLSRALNQAGSEAEHTALLGKIDDVLSQMEEEGGDRDEPEDQFRDDVEADADVLASAGWGMDEDYGCYGDDDFF